MKTSLFEYISSSEKEQIQLFCFHYAGGSAFDYSGLREYLPDNIGIYPFQLPGRGKRRNDRYPSSVREAAEEAAEAINSIIKGPFILLGHSMGGMIASVAAQILQEEYGLFPERLFVTASVPDFGETSRINSMLMSPLDDDEFCRKLVEFNAVDKRILGLRRFREEIFPVTRVDFTMAEKYHADSSVKLKCGISVYGGLNDKVVRPAQLSEWGKFTLSDTTIRLFDGDHFFIREYMPEICLDIIKISSAVVRQGTFTRSR